MSQILCPPPCPSVQAVYWGVLWGPRRNKSSHIGCRAAAEMLWTSSATRGAKDPPADLSLARWIHGSANQCQLLSAPNPSCMLGMEHSSSLAEVVDILQDIPVSSQHHPRQLPPRHTTAVHWSHYSYRDGKGRNSCLCCSRKLSLTHTMNTLLHTYETCQLILLRYFMIKSDDGIQDPKEMYTARKKGLH